MIHIVTEKSDVPYILISHLGNSNSANYNKMFIRENDSSTKNLIN